MNYTASKNLKNIKDFEISKGYFLKEKSINNFWNESFNISFEGANQAFDFGTQIIVLDNLNRPYILGEDNLDLQIANTQKIISTMAQTADNQWIGKRTYSIQEPKLIAFYEALLLQI